MKSTHINGYSVVNIAKANFERCIIFFILYIIYVNIKKYIQNIKMESLDSEVKNELNFLYIFSWL